MLRKWRALTAGIEPAVNAAPAVIEALADDVNTAGAIAELHRLASAEKAAELLASARLLGLLSDDLGGWESRDDSALDAIAQTLSDARRIAMETKDFAEVDRLRAALIDAGIQVRMSKDGVELEPDAGFDPAKLEALK